MNWFSKSNQKESCSFVQMDKKVFFPSITKKVLNVGLNFAKAHAAIIRDEIITITLG